MRSKLRLVFSAALMIQLGALVAVAQGGQANPAATEAGAVPIPPEEEIPAVPVVIDGRTILYIYAAVGGYSAAERAEAVRERIVRLAATRGIPVESLHIEEREPWSEIRDANGTIMAVTDQDAQIAGRTRQHLAAEDLELIRQEVHRYREDHRWKKLLLGVLYAILATLALVAVLRGLWKVRGVVRGGFERWIKAFQQRPVASQWRFTLTSYFWRPLLLLGQGFFWLIVLAVVQGYVTAVLRFFPQTYQASLKTTSWLSSQLSGLGNAVVSYLPNLLTVAIISAVTYALLSFKSRLFRDIELGRIRIAGFYPDWARPTANLVRILVLALAAVVMFPYLPGSKSPAFQGITIFLGVLVSLGSSSAVANAVAGTILNYMRAFQVGDMVRIGDVFGEVMEKKLFVTRVRSTPKTEIITIPNGLVMNSAVKNYSAAAGTAGVTLYTSVTIGYDAPWRRVHELLISAALATSHILKEPAPFVLQTALNDFYVSYELNAYTDTPARMAAIYSELHQNIQDKFNEGGVEINSPHYAAVRDGNAVTIPEGYRPSSYQPPAFRVRTSSVGREEK